MADAQPTFTITTNDAAETTLIHDDPPVTIKPAKDPLGTKGATNVDTP